MIYFLLLAFVAPVYAAHVSVTELDATTQKLSVVLDVPEGSYLYKDYLSISVDDPSVQLSALEIGTEPVAHYDAGFQETKKVFKQTTSLSCTAHAKDAVPKQASVHITYYLNTRKKIETVVFPLQFSAPQLITAVDVADSAVETLQNNNNAPSPTLKQPIRSESMSWSSYLALLIKKTDSLLFRLLLVFALGLLLSLTPCIYPMIPITIGILQAQGTQSLSRNFMISFAYVLGIAVTFACLGLIAAFTGQVFGTFMHNPVVIIGIVCMLIYLALSMFGFYEIYIPKRFTRNATVKTNGTLISVFLFGLASGTVSSPCLSPGLVLLLSLVSTINNVWMGFLLLFVFGLGLGIPLLIIGTFSSSINLMPKAGYWMVEIKTLFGFMMLAICFYFLNFLLPWSILGPLVCVYVAVVGIYYLYHGYKAHGWQRWIKNIVGIILMAASFAGVLNMYIYSCLVNPVKPFWNQYSYQETLQKAQEDHKYIFISFGSPTCSLCTAIDKKIFNNREVSCFLEDFHRVKIDGSKSEYQQLLKQFNIIGFPTYILLHPTTQQEIHRWSSELYDMSPELFMAAVQKQIT